MKDDDKIESFFEGMKKAESRMPVPPFEKPAVRERIRSAYRFYYAAAALAVIVVASVFIIGLPSKDTKKEEVVFVDPGLTETGSLLDTDEMTIFNWQSPTDGLLEEF